jgi:hypothetical protein
MSAAANSGNKTLANEIYEDNSGEVWDSNYHHNNNSSGDSDDQTKMIQDHVGGRGNGDNGKREALGSLVQCLAHSSLIVLTFILLSIWLSYSLDECPSF